MATSPFTIPGQFLGPASKFCPGPGVHLHKSNLYSSLLGTVSVSTPPPPPAAAAAAAAAAAGSSSPSSASQGPAKRRTRITQNLPCLDATHNPQHQHQQQPTISVGPTALPSGRQREVLPQVGNVVLCRVTRITPRQAVVAILVCGAAVLAAEWQGVIRVQDVRATEKDRVRIYESFRPGDIVRASVISLGDQANYYLSTASNELGVIMAVSEAGNVMYPVSWREYKDPETGLSESRKVAKPF